MKDPIRWVLAAVFIMAVDLAVAEQLSNEWIWGPDDSVVCFANHAGGEELRDWSRWFTSSGSRADYRTAAMRSGGSLRFDQTADDTGSDTSVLVEHPVGLSHISPPERFAGVRGLVLSSSSPWVEDPWGGGVDVHMGQWFGRDRRHAVEAAYWGIYDAGGDWDHRWVTALNESSTVNNAELNWLYSPTGSALAGDGGSPVRLMALAGFRYFGTAESADERFTWQPSELYRRTHSRNIFGAQIGGRFDWGFYKNLRLVVVPKLMIGGNSRVHSRQLLLGNHRWHSFSHADRSLALLTSLDLGISWDFAEHCGLTAGYRVLGLIDANSNPGSYGYWPTTSTNNMLIHGTFIGLEGRF